MSKLPLKLRKDHYRPPEPLEPPEHVVVQLKILIKPNPPIDAVSVVTVERVFPTESESHTEPDSYTGPESHTEPDSYTGPESSTELEPESHTELELESHTELEPESHTELELELEHEREHEPEPEDTEITIKLKTHPTFIPPTYQLMDTGCKSKRPCRDEHCRRCYEKSFCSKERSKDWSTENTKPPRLVCRSSGSKFWFNCPRCGHTYKQAPNAIEMPKRNRGCAFCHDNQRRCTDLNCQECYKNSFAVSEVNQKWHWSPKNGDLNPRDIARSGKKTVWLVCDVCHHDFESPTNGASRKKPRGCPYCGKRKLCDDKMCHTCFGLSFASHPRAKNWSEKNEVKPTKVHLNSNLQYLFVCDSCGHEFKSYIKNVTQLNTWCPDCRRKTELKLHNWLISHNLEVKRGHSFSWCKSEKDARLPFDFVIEDLKLIIELDGAQHFKQVQKWPSPEQQQNNDVYKMSKALEHGYSCIRILQNDVWRDHNDWENKLLNVIKSYQSPSVVYIDNGTTYDAHKNKTK
jgi:very-short-patch-repair endonuclease